MKTDRYYVEIEGFFVKHTGKAIVIMDYSSGKDICVPVSELVDWRFTYGNGKHGLTLRDLGYGDEITVKFPKWIAKKDGVIE